MPRSRRHTPTSLAIPDSLAGPETADENAAYVAAREASRQSVIAVRQAREDERTGKNRDAAPAELRRLREATEDAEHAWRTAKRAEDQAGIALAHAIDRERVTMLARLDIDTTGREALDALQTFADVFERLTYEVGAAQTIATIDSERTRTRGFEPHYVTTGDRHTSPDALLAALHAHVAELRDLAEKLTAQPTRELETAA